MKIRDAYSTGRSSNLGETRRWVFARNMTMKIWNAYLTVISLYLEETWRGAFAWGLRGYKTRQVSAKGWGPDVSVHARPVEVDGAGETCQVCGGLQ